MPQCRRDVPIWLRPEITGRGRAPGYSRAQIAQAAVAIADAEGLDAVTMRRVAKAVGAGPMTLYSYVCDKDELLLLMADEVQGRSVPAWPDSPDPTGSQTLRLAARMTRRAVLDHPWWAQITVPPTPNGAQALEQIMARLDHLGLDIHHMLELVRIVQAFAFGFARNESHLRGDSGEPTNYLRSLMDDGDHPFLRRIVEAGAHRPDPDDYFERCLDRVIAGIHATLLPAS